jgi:hypothetical protein
VQTIIKSSFITLFSQVSQLKHDTSLITALYLIVSKPNYLPISFLKSRVQSRQEKLCAKMQIHRENQCPTNQIKTKIHPITMSIIELRIN